MSWYQGRDNKKSKVSELEISFRQKKRRQEGVEFPSAGKQEQVLIIRFNISHSILEKGNFDVVRRGLKQLCMMLEEIDNGDIQFVKLSPNGDRVLVKLSEFNFSATIGFGKGFFDKLRISTKNRPKKLKEMPNHIELGDSIPYTLVQTDMIIQLCSNNEDVNLKIFENNTGIPLDNNKSNKKTSDLYIKRKKGQVVQNTPTEIYSQIRNWAEIVDMHMGFQRIDGKSLLGFNDGISNPRRLSNDVVWTTLKDEDQKYTDGTYMVFQKIEHDLEKWRTLDIDKQEKLIGRSKGTGLLLGTLSTVQDRKLGQDLLSDNNLIRARAQRMWQKLYDEQKDPDRKFFDTAQKQYKNIQLECPVWSHVRKANPRGFHGAARHLIFRRGYLFMDRSGRGFFRSGLLFICFQRNVEDGFEHIKKLFLDDPKLTNNNSKEELVDTNYNREKKNYDIHNNVAGNKTNNLYPIYKNHSTPMRNHESYLIDTGKSSSESSIPEKYSEGKIPGTITLGGGYYFIPPIPNKRISDLSEQFFL